MKASTIRRSKGFDMKVKQDQRTCVDCGELIPIERLRTLPDTYTCVRCSAEKPKTLYEADQSIPVVEQYTR